MSHSTQPEALERERPCQGLLLGAGGGLNIRLQSLQR